MKRRSPSPFPLVEFAVLVGVILASLLLLFVCDTQAADPMPGIIVPCQVVDVYDGDTLTVRISCDVRVRLLDCWAAELHTTDPHEKQLGTASAAALKTLAEGRSGQLIIPLSGATRLDDLFTFGRLLGDVHIEGEKATVGQQQIRSGQAYKTKQELQRALDSR